MNRIIRSNVVINGLIGNQMNTTFMAVSGNQMNYSTTSHYGNSSSHLTALKEKTAKEFNHDKLDISLTHGKSLRSISAGLDQLEHGNLDEGERMIVNGFQLLRKSVDFQSSLFAVPTYALGVASLKKGNFKNSEKLLKISIGKAEGAMDNKSFNKALPFAYNDLALSLVRQKKGDEALQALQKAESLSNSTSTPHAYSPFILTNLGELYKTRSSFDQSKMHHGMAHLQLISRGTMEVVNMFRCLMNRAQISRMSGNRMEGKEFLLEATKLLQVNPTTNTFQIANSEIPTSRYLTLTSLLKPKKFSILKLDHAKYLIECGHFHFDDDNVMLAIQTLKDAREIFSKLNILHAPDSVLNTLNLAILERKYPVMEHLTQPYVASLLSGIDTTHALLANHPYFRGKSVDAFVSNLGDFTQPSDSYSAINLIPPLHFPLF